jgi:hypothetical protein
MENKVLEEQVFGIIYKHIWNELIKYLLYLRIVTWNTEEPFPWIQGFEFLMHKIKCHIQFHLLHKHEYWHHTQKSDTGDNHTVLWGLYNMADFSVSIK